jgi:hypothetical protein
MEYAAWSETSSQPELSPVFEELITLFDPETDEELCECKHEYDDVYSCERYDFPGEIECYFYDELERSCTAWIVYVKSTRRRMYFAVEEVDGSEAEEEGSDDSYSTGEYARYGSLDFGSESE